MSIHVQVSYSHALPVGTEHCANSKVPFQTGIRNRRRTGCNNRPFIIIYLLFRLYPVPYATPKAAAQSAAKPPQIPKYPRRPTQTTTHYPDASPVRNRHPLSIPDGDCRSSAPDTEIHANRPSERPPPGQRAPDRVRNGRHSRRASAPPRRNVPTTPPGHKERPTYRPPHRAGGRGMPETAEQRSPPPNRTDT